MIDQPSTSPDLAMPFPITSAARRQARAYAAQYFRLFRISREATYI
jgi:hypothetical protein